MYRDAAAARGVELSARSAAPNHNAGFKAFTFMTVVFLLAAAHDAVLLGVASQNLLLVPTVPFALLWAWRQRAILKGPSVWRVPEGIELRDAAGTRLVRVGDAIAVRRWGPRWLQVAYLDWRAGVSRHRLFFACRADLPEDALAPGAPLLEQPLALRSAPRPKDPIDPHGTRALLLPLMPPRAIHLDDGSDSSGFWLGALGGLGGGAFASVIANASWLSSRWSLIAALFGVSMACQGFSSRQVPRLGLPFIEPTEAALVLHRPKHRVIPWSQVTSAVIAENQIHLSIAGSVFGVVRLLSPRVLNAVFEQRRRDGDAPNVPG